MAIPEELYPRRKGATDSEALFLLALAEGLDSDPLGAMSRAVSRLETLSRQKGGTPHVRLAAALSDGERLYAVRYASDDRAPTLYHRLNAEMGGRAVVSEPLEPEGDWLPIKSGRFCVFEAGKVTEMPFAPVLAAAA